MSDVDAATVDGSAAPTEHDSSAPAVVDVAIAPGKCVFSREPFVDLASAKGAPSFEADGQKPIFAACLWVDTWSELAAKTRGALGETLLGQFAKLGVDGAYLEDADAPQRFEVPPSSTRASSYQVFPARPSQRISEVPFWEAAWSTPGRHRVCVAVTTRRTGQGVRNKGLLIRRIAEGCFDWIVP